MTRASGGARGPATRVDCAHPRARHEHGSFAAYQQDECRCAPCSRANTEKKRADRARPVVRVRAADLDAARARLLDLRASGAPFSVLARVIGCDRATLARIAKGLPTARPDVVDAVLLLTPRALRTQAPRPARAIVDGGPTRARLRALVSIGWTCAAIARRTELNTSLLWAVLRDDKDVRLATHEAVARAYDELWRAGPACMSDADHVASERARARAARAGWARPMDLDDGALGARAPRRAAA